MAQKSKYWSRKEIKAIKYGVLFTVFIYHFKEHGAVTKPTIQFLQYNKKYNQKKTLTSKKKIIIFH